MALPEFLTQIVVCPACRGELVETPTALTCAQCALSYPIRDSIPVLLVDEATALPRDV